MRLLPEWTGDVGRCAARGQQASLGYGYRCRHAGQHLPLRNLSTHSRRHQASGAIAHLKMGAMTKTSTINARRRMLLKAAGVAGAGLTLGFRLDAAFAAQAAAKDAASSAPFQPNAFVR